MNFFKKLFKKKSKPPAKEIVSFLEFRAVMNNISRKKIISLLPENNKEKLIQIVNEGYKSLNYDRHVNKDQVKIHNRNILSLINIYLLYGKNIKIIKKD